MLVELEIENLALFERTRIPFGPGLNAITGETGAGKSLVLAALALISGSRADRNLVRDGSEECRVTALLEVSDELLPEIQELAAPAAVEDGSVLLTRRVGVDGKGKCYVNGRLVPLSTLSAIAERLFDILGQKESSRLASADYRARLLDRNGSSEDARAAYSTARVNAREARDRREQLARDRSDRLRKLEFAQYQLDEIESSNLQPGELARLEQELSLLEGADELKSICADGQRDLYETDDAVIDRLSQFARQIESLSDGPKKLLQGGQAALQRAIHEVEDAVAEFRSASDRVDLDPTKLGQVNQRVDVLRRLMDRFGPHEEDLQQHHAELQIEVESLSKDEEDSKDSEDAVRKASIQLQTLGDKLDRKRARAGKHLAASVQERLSELGMTEAVFRCVLKPNESDDIIDRAMAYGLSQVDFLLAANPGHEAQPLAAVASGGESARIALALRQVQSTALNTPVMVFDEVESGIGARLGEAVANSLRRLAGERQVICVTHLPQVAAFGESHVLITKETDGERTTALAQRLEGQSRESEIASMMRGKRVASTTRKEAQALLKQAGEES